MRNDIVKQQKLQSADREYRNSANRAIRGDIVRALNELVLNSDDSYSRMGEPARPVAVLIRRLAKRDGGGALLSVRDCAEGMAGETLDKALGIYGEAASGIYAGATVRGYFGHGLKDAVLGLGRGSIHSFLDGSYTNATLELDGSGAPIYTRHREIAATDSLRARFGISENGTVVEIITNDDISIPQFERLKEALSRHFLLRRVMANPNSLVTLQYEQVTRQPESASLRYLEPVPVETVVDEMISWGIGYTARLVVHRASVPLESPTTGPTTDGGILVCAGTSVLDHTLFRFEGDAAAEYIYGYVESDGFVDLLREDAPILQATRDGLVWTYPVLAQLRTAIEARLEPAVEAERARIRQQDQHARDHALRERLSKTFAELNKIADAELTTPGGPAKGKGSVVDPPPPEIPEAGFGFIHEYFNIVVAHDASILLRASADLFTTGDPVSVRLITEGDITLKTDIVELKPSKDHPAILEARVIVKGNRAGAQSILIGQCAGYEAECLLQVVTGRTPPPPPPPQRGGLFRELRFDTQSDPRARVRYDRESGDIVIQTLAPSVNLYIREGGLGAETPQGAVLCAELVLEAVCREVARRGVESGTFIAPTGGEAEAINREFDRLRIKYAEPIHQLLVTGTEPTRRGRVRASEAMASAATPI